jgi:capsular polysaccharide transport system permease protein
VADSKISIQLRESLSYSETTFIGSVRIQGRVIKALSKRDILARFGREGLGFLWLILEPAIFTVGVAVLFTFFMSHDGQHSDIPIAAFCLTGYSTIMLWRGMTGKLLGAVKANRGLLYHRNVKVIDLCFSRALIETIACGTALIFVTLVFWGLGIVSLPVDPLSAFFGYVFYAWFSFNVACIFAYAFSVSEVVERIAHVVLYLSIPLMGGFFMVSWMPDSVQSFLLLSPLVNAIELLREGFFGTNSGAKYSISYLIYVNLPLTLIGLILLRKIKRQLIDS